MTRTWLKMLFLTLTLLLLAGSTPAQATRPHDFARWESAISGYEKADEAARPAPGGIVFIGSSTILRWKTLAEDFSGYPVLNRGFGGSQIVDATHFADRIVIPYRPRQVFLRSGGNDLHAGKSPAEVFADFKAFVAKIHSRLPQTEIVFIGLCPTIARWKESAANRELNQLVIDYTKQARRVKYIETYGMSLDQHGVPRSDVFVNDMLHFNAEGYRLLIDLVRPHLRR
jgi:lysophospholipase L1-like esterase